MRNVWVIELGQDLAFQLQPRMHSNRKYTALHDFYGNLLLKLGISSFG